MTFKQTFGTWLVSQRERPDQIGKLADSFYCFMLECKYCDDLNLTPKSYRKPSDFYKDLNFLAERYTVKIITIAAYCAAKEYSAYRRKINLKILLPRQSDDDTLRYVFARARGKELNPIRFCMPGQSDRNPLRKVMYLDL